MAIDRTTFDDFAAISSPAASTSGKGRVYFDSTANKFKVSENGGGYVQLVGDVGILGVNTQTDNYQLVLSDTGKLVTINNAAAKTLTIPANATVAFQVGTIIFVAQLGAGQVDVAGAGGVTVNPQPGSNQNIKGQYGQVVLTKIGTDSWIVAGNLETV